MKEHKTSQKIFLREHSDFIQRILPTSRNFSKNSGNFSRRIFDEISGESCKGIPEDFMEYMPSRMSFVTCHENLPRENKEYVGECVYGPNENIAKIFVDNPLWFSKESSLVLKKNK